MAKKINVIDNIEVQMYRLTPKNGVNILEASNSKDNTTAPVKKISKRYLLKWFFSEFKVY